MYQYGYGVKRDYEKAVEYLLKLANKGHAVAQYRIGIYSSIIIK